jgi:hypothetical protein
MFAGIIANPAIAGFSAALTQPYIPAYPPNGFPESKPRVAWQLHTAKFV